jgi:hypothetical protein
MDLVAFDELSTSLLGVRRVRSESLARWECRGRLVARQLDDTHVVVRVPFDVRDLLVRQAPSTFSIPNRFAKHMMIVADLAGGDDDAIADAVTSAWRLQTEGH